MGQLNVNNMEYLLFGCIIALLGRFMSEKLLLPSQSKYKVLDKTKYIKSCRMLLYCLGVYYIVFGIMMLFVTGESGYFIIFELFIPFMFFIPLIFIFRKYTRPIR